MILNFTWKHKFPIGYWNNRKFYLYNIHRYEKIEKDFEIINFQSRLESLIHIESVLLQNSFGKFFQEIFECFGVHVLFFKIDQVISFGDTSLLNGFEYTFNPNFTDMDSDIIFETKKLLFTKEVGNEKLATGSHTTNWYFHCVLMQIWFWGRCNCIKNIYQNQK